MGVRLYRLRIGVSRNLRIGDTVHAIGVVVPACKITEIGQRGASEIERVEALRDREAARPVVTPRLVGRSPGGTALLRITDRLSATP